MRLVFLYRWVVVSGFSAKQHVAVNQGFHVEDSLTVYVVREGCRRFDDALAAERPFLELKEIEERAGVAVEQMVSAEGLESRHQCLSSTA